MMLTLDLRFPPEIRVALQKFVTEFDESLTHSIADEAVIPADSDEDFAAMWHDSRLAGIDADMKALRELLSLRMFGKGAVSLEPEFALNALRGFTAIRLALRESILDEIPDEALEKGEVDRDDLPLSVRHGYACYGALGEIQAALCEVLDH